MISFRGSSGSALQCLGSQRASPPRGGHRTLNFSFPFTWGHLGMDHDHMHWRGRPFQAAQDVSGPEAMNTDRVPPPYASLSVPVYSLSTLGNSCLHPASSGCDPFVDEYDATPDSMNIVTYFAPMAIKPDRVAAIGLYRDTISWKNMLRNQRGVLQLLGHQHMKATYLLGKQSATRVDKRVGLEDLGLPTTQWEGHTVLTDAVGYMLLEFYLPPAQDIIHAGDHDVVICKVLKWDVRGDPERDALYTGDLRKAGHL